jgi:hypothetical protein
METLKHRTHRGFDLAKQLSMAVSFVGVLLMISHLAGQLREGSAPGWSLFVGATCFLCGLIFTLLFAIMIRLHRIEQRLSDSDSVEESDEDGDPEPTNSMRSDSKAPE